MSDHPPAGNAGPAPGAPAIAAAAAAPPLPPSRDDAMLVVARVPLPVVRAALMIVRAADRAAQDAEQHQQIAVLAGYLEAAVTAAELVDAHGQQGVHSFTDWTQRLQAFGRRVAADARIEPGTRCELATAVQRLAARTAFLAATLENDRTPPGYTPGDVAGAAVAHGRVVGRSCSWCHTLNYCVPNLVGMPVCSSCGHNPYKPRVECNCPKCRRQEGGING